MQKNNRELEILIKEAILTTIRENIPIEQILRSYMEETEEQEIITEPVPVAETITNEQKVNINDASLNTVPFEEKLGDLAKKIEDHEKDIDNKKNDENIKPQLIVKEHEKLEEIEEPSKEDTTKLSIDFSDIDNAVDIKGITQDISAPKDIETLNKISEINNAKRKEEDDDDDDDKLVIGEDIGLAIDTVTLDSDPILGDIISL